MSELRHSNRRKSNYRRKGHTGRGPAYPLIVAAMALAAAYAVVNPDAMPRPAERAASAYRDIGRDHAPTAGAYYANCDQARAAGVAPIYAGEAGFRDTLDADGDGVACEPYRGQ